MSTRTRPPPRRANLSFAFEHTNHDGRSFHYTATIGFYDKTMQKPCEVFVGSVKVGTDTDIAAKDAAIALSLGLQYGVPIEVFAKTFLRRPDGSPEGPLGTLIDIVMKELEK